MKLRITGGGGGGGAVVGLLSYKELEKRDQPKL